MLLIQATSNEVEAGFNSEWQIDVTKIFDSTINFHAQIIPLRHTGGTLTRALSGTEGTLFESPVTGTDMTAELTADNILETAGNDV